MTIELNTFEAERLENILKSHLLTLEKQRAGIIGRYSRGDLERKRTLNTEIASFESILQKMAKIEPTTLYDDRPQKTS